MMTALQHLLAAVDQLAPETNGRFADLVKFLEDDKREAREICARVAAELSIYIQYGELPKVML